MRDDFPEDVKRTLCNRLANRCSYCDAVTSGPQDDESKAVNIGVAAHITAASPDGPRYDVTLTPEQRRHPSNGIWLCQNHAKMIDNDESRYSPATIREWKASAEARADRELTKRGQGARRGLRIELPKPQNRPGYLSAGSYVASTWRVKVRLIANGEQPLDIVELGVREEGVGEWTLDEVFWEGTGRATSFPIRVNPSAEFWVSSTSPKPSDTKPPSVGTLTLWFRDHTQPEGDAHEYTTERSE
jgi:hypothetical protein